MAVVKSGAPFETPVQQVQMIGRRRAEQLARLKIFSVHDLLYHFPREYLDRSQTVSPFGQADGAAITVRGAVIRTEESRPRRNLTITKAALEAREGVFYAVWFNQAHVKKLLRPGADVLISGKVDQGFGSVQIQVQDFALVDENQNGDNGDLLHTGRLTPVYPATNGISQRQLRSFIYTALAEWENAYHEFIPPWLIEQENLPPLPAALRQIHFPDRQDSAAAARRRFVFEEFFLIQVQLLKLRQNLSLVQKQHRYPPDNPLQRAYLAGLKFTLTAAQQQAAAEIAADLQRPYPMNRLLQGDVGSGKTAVAVLALLKAVEGGLQGAFMAPTEVLAEQHFFALHELLTPLGVSVALLGGGMPAKARRDLLARLAGGEVSLMVGTQAILQPDVQFKNLALVVIDEQHRFGVRQRALLQEKALQADVLIMTATPIPRTLSMTVYGDLDISLIDSMPPGRQPARTYYVAPGELTRVFQFVSAQVETGRQAFIICPLVEESEKIDLQAAEELYSRLAANELRRCQVGLLHGRMAAKEKEAVMAGFRAGEIQVLVSTTVVEVGVDVPNANVMVIIDADRYGLAQLHQLRGRVGRGGGEAHCILA
ncbi:MAG: ATP-dependent DNA helicase RecG, partial [Firmicutes bacterium]|nr:ATP-dependent DNA helicase RecG [Bacillota bacterium]